MDVQGNRHHDNTDRGSPVKIGGKAKTSAPSAVADGDRVDAYFDTSGRQVVVAVNSAGADLGGGGEGAILDGVSPVIKATVFDYTNANPLSVRLTDTNGDYAAAGGGTQYTEDAAAAADPVGTAPILVRKDTPATITTTDGDNIAQRATNYGAAYVQIVSSTGSFVDTFGGGTQYTEGDTDASITGTAILWEDSADTLRAVSVAKPLPISDAGGSLTVDGTVAVSGTVAVTQSGTWDEVGINDSGNSITVDAPVGTPANVQVGDGSNTATVRNLASNDALNVAITDSSGNQVSTFGGGTQYTEGDTDASITGTAMLWEDGSDTLRSVSSGKPLPVNVVAGSAATPSFVEDTAHVSGDSGVMMLGVRNDASAVLTSADGDYSPIMVNNSGAVGVFSDGDLGVQVNNSVLVDGSYDPNAAYNSAATNLLVTGAVRNDNAATVLADTDGDFGPIAIDDKGRLGISDLGGTITVDGTVAVTHSALTELAGAIDTEMQVDVITLPAVTGAAAHASPTSGNPVYVAGRASTAVPTDVGADGDAAAFWMNRNGATVVTMAPHIGLIGSPFDLIHEGVQYTTTQTSAVLVAGGASEKLVVTNIQIQAFDTSAGDVIVYFGTGAYSRGTNRAIFDGTFKPSSTLAPGINMQGPFISGTNGDDIMVTTTNNVDVTISVWYYVVT